MAKHQSAAGIWRWRRNGAAASAAHQQWQRINIAKAIIAVISAAASMKNQYQAAKNHGVSGGGEIAKISNGDSVKRNIMA